NCEQTYFKNAHLGDAIYNTKQLESVSDQKQTALGEGYFITELWTFFNQHDEKVAEMRFRLLKFKAPSGA
ncbi:MAG TPA: DNA-binding protein, partial [Pseudomonadales bacterium]